MCRKHLAQQEPGIVRHCIAQSPVLATGVRGLHPQCYHLATRRPRTYKGLRLEKRTCFFTLDKGGPNKGKKSFGLSA